MSSCPDITAEERDRAAEALRVAVDENRARQALLDIFPLGSFVIDWLHRTCEVVKCPHAEPVTISAA